MTASNPRERIASAGVDAQHAAYRRDDPAAGPEAVRGRVARLRDALAGSQVDVRYWDETLPYASTDPRAADLLARAMSGPGQGRAGKALRVLHLAYADGVADLLLSAFPTRTGRAGLATVAGYLLGDTDDPPAGGLPPARDAAAQRYVDPDRDWASDEDGAPSSTIVRSRALAADVEGFEAVAASIALALAKRTGRSRIVLRVELPAEGHAARALPALDTARRVAFDVPATADVAGAMRRLAREVSQSGPGDADEDADAALQLPLQDSAHVRLLAARTHDRAPLRFALRRAAQGWHLDVIGRGDAIGAQALQSLLEDVIDILVPASPVACAPAVVATVDPRRGHNLHARVIATCVERPARPAVSGRSGVLDYAELQARADAVTRHLRSQGCGRGSLVGVCMSRDLGFVVAMLGIMGAGAAYVPLDPAYPDERLRYSAKDANLALVVVETPRAPFEGFATLVVDAKGIVVSGEAAAGVEPCVATREDLAYVIYTSGSTGKPKGVMIDHASVLNLLDGTVDRLRFGSSDTWTCFHSFAFDFSVWEVWACLTTGGRLVIVPEDVCRSPDAFLQLLADEQVTVLNQTPSALAQIMMTEAFARGGLRVRLVITAGEALQPRLLLRWFDRYSETACEVFNIYGITETTVHATWKKITRVEALRDDRSIGVAIPGWSVLVLDADGRRCRPGVPGEIWIGGGGLARGYLGRPGLSASRFRPAPAAGAGGERLYRSGDKGRLRPDGEIEYLGRLDHQVKVRGYRIELGEIRAKLLEYSGVQDAAVVVARRGEASDPFIDAYVVGPDVSVADLWRRLSEALPAHMMPATLTRLEALPLTVNGKVDQRRLVPGNAASGPGAASVAAPTGAIAPAAPSLEGKVTDIWRHVLGIDVGIDDNFFLIGGNSLLAIRVTRRMQEQDIAHATARHLYSNPTVRGLCAALQHDR